ncbi:zf-HC2 domain-containing protein [Planococcus donghaensis]|uniref:Putative zinc-finger domain-containing protein n=1 Tax=Planococcus donghaensis TaxID=414778 RepID=A0A1C7EGZ7_9BACL|nr:zf-HC2 domain-containing protein [Planococcus donghaensis]ANU23333.1 hypothetical protein BCM40_08085 [Planococcus donghaensis]
MKNECYIVRDLMPSYIDQLCSDESRRFIEQHVKGCASCSHVLQQMRAELNDGEKVELPSRIEQKKPFEKISNLLKAQGNFSQFLKASFWLSLLITIILLAFSFNNFIPWQENQQEAERVEQQRQEMMDKAFAALPVEGLPDKTALQTVFDQYEEQLQHIAVFAKEDVREISSLPAEPSAMFPIDYEKALLVVGENGEITEPIVPNEYDIGTIVMASEEKLVQFEYKNAYLKTVENAHQTKYYSLKVWELFSLPLAFGLTTLFIFAIWSYQKRIMKPLRPQVG